jgi:hypothetical protein
MFLSTVTFPVIADSPIDEDPSHHDSIPTYGKTKYVEKPRYLSYMSCNYNKLSDLGMFKSSIDVHQMNGISICLSMILNMSIYSLLYPSEVTCYLLAACREPFITHVDYYFISF